MYINALLESEEVQTLVANNSEILAEGAELISEFPTILKSFVMENTVDFIGENAEETAKNIRVFSEVATAQLLAEISDLSASIISENEAIDESVIEEEIKDNNPTIEDYI